MDAKTKQPKTLQDAIRYFTDEQVCIDTVAALRWTDGPTCPACEKKDHYYLKTQKRWKCKECGRQFSVKLGTIFEDSPLGLDKWLAALWMLVNCKNGISSYEIARDLGITQKSAWFMLHRLRLALQNGSIVKLGGSGKEVEVDETFVGGKARFMHKDKRIKTKVRENNWAKAVVMGMLERDGKVKAAVIPNRKKPALHAVIQQTIEHGTQLYTDEHVGYQGLTAEYAHSIINHLEGYVDGKIHTNGIENFWSCLKRGINGTYIAVEPFHLFRYVDEQAFRYNNRRELKDVDRFNLALSQIAGKRLTYSTLTGKDTDLF